MIKTVFIVGPTGIGKTEYAINYALKHGGEIISADSMQIYKYMDIGSAKPTPEERKLVKHYLVDEIDPSSSFSVYDYKQLAMGYIRKVYSEGKLPIVCGGTGLYVNALVYDMDFSAPEGDQEFRDRMQELVKKQAEEDPSIFEKSLYIEKELEADEKNLGFAESLKLLEPYGEGNPVPVFCVLSASVSGVRTMGAEEQHIRFTAVTDDGVPLPCVLFGRADEYKDIIFGAERIDVAGELDINEFRGERRLQMRVRDIRASER